MSKAAICRLLRMATARSGCALRHLIQSNPESLYQFWRDVENAPKWQEQIVSVTAKSATLSHWVMQSGDDIIEWDSEILADEPGKRIAWASVAGDSHNAGEVIFEKAVGTRGTLVTVLQEFRNGQAGQRMGVHRRPQSQTGCH